MTEEFKGLDCNRTQNQNHFVHDWTLNHLAKLALNDWAVLWALICMVHLTVYSYHATYTFQSESTLYSCLNVKELLARKRHNIWSLSDCNGTLTHNQLVHKPSSLTKWLSVHLQTKCLWVRVLLQSLKLQISYLLQARSSLTFRQL